MPRKKSAASRSLPEPLPQPEVLLGVFYDWTAAAHTDRPSEVEAQLRALLPGTLEAAQQRRLARPFVENVGVVRRSAEHGCLWFTQPKSPRKAFVVHPDHVPDGLRALVTVVEPKVKLEPDLHTVCKPPKHPSPDAGA